MATVTETVLDNVLSYLKSNLPSRLEDEGLEQPDLNEGYLFGVPDLRSPLKMPLVAVDLDEATLRQRTLGPAATGKIEHRIPVQIFVFVAHQDIETLFRQLLRYADKIVETIDNDPTLSGKATYCQVGLADFSPVLEGVGEAVFVRAALVRLDVTVRRTRGKP